MMQTDKNTLQGYTIQQLQLELIRRCKGWKVQGEALVRFLLEHQTLWQGVMADSIYNVCSPTSGRSELPSLYKLSGLAENQWRAKTLYVLCANEADAQQLHTLGVQEGVWREKDMWLYDAFTSFLMLGRSDIGDTQVMAIRLG